MNGKQDKLDSSSPDSNGKGKKTNEVTNNPINSPEEVETNEKKENEEKKTVKERSKFGDSIMGWIKATIRKELTKIYEEMDENKEEIDKKTEEMGFRVQKLETMIKIKEEEINELKRCRNEQKEEIEKLKDTQKMTENRVESGKEENDIKDGWIDMGVQDDEISEKIQMIEKELGRHRNIIKDLKDMELDKEIKKLERKHFETREEVLRMQNMQKLKEMETGNKKQVKAKNSDEIKEFKQEMERNKQEIEKKILDLEKLNETRNEKETKSASSSTNEEKIRELQQDNRKKNVEIYNVPQKENENLREIVIKIGEKKGMIIKKEDIDVVYRFITRGKTEHKPILVQFTRKITRDEFVKWRKEEDPITQNEIIKGGRGDEKILIYDNLSPYFKNLRYLARKWADKYNFRSVWYKDYKIIIRKNKEENIFYAIKSEQELEDLEKKVETRDERG